MTLRTRLLVTTMAVALPLAAGLFVLAERSRHADMETTLERAIDTSGCGPGSGGQGPGSRVQGPRSGRRGGPPVDVFPYDATLSIATPDGRGPVFPEALRMPLLETGRAAGVYVTDDGRGRQVAARVTDPSAPCAYVLARVRPRPGEWRDQLIALSSVVLTVFIAVFIAAGPTAARIHRLASEVKRSAGSQYAVPVPVDGRDEVAALAQAFNDAGTSVRAHVDRVEAREAALRDFVANTTHDVAVPLTVLQSHLSALELAALPGEATDRVRQAMREAHYMGSLLRNLGAASRLEGGVAAQAIDLDLNALVERVVARHEPLARAAGVDLNVAVPGTPITVTADHTLLEQALGNLVDNAVRYNHPGGHVAVVLDRSSAGPHGFTVTVSDDGVGVAAGELPQLSSRQFRGDAARSRRPGGQGLGLAITAEVIGGAGWSLSFSHNHPQGLCARVHGTSKS